MTDDVYDRFERHGVVAVLVIDEASTAPDIGTALKNGGLPVAEVTLRTAESDRALAILAADPELVVGAGTVLTVAQAERAVAAGARFLVSPGLAEDVVRAARRLGVPLIPGVGTATEIMTALRLGLPVVKLFPAEPVGGIGMVRALSAPFPALRFVPTGGIGAPQLEGYLREPAVLAVGGSWLVAPSLIRQRNWAAITALTEAAVAIARRVRPTAPRS